MSTSQPGRPGIDNLYLLCAELTGIRGKAEKLGRGIHGYWPAFSLMERLSSGNSAAGGAVVWASPPPACWHSLSREQG